MTSVVSLPFWLVVLLVVFALVGLFDRLLAPSFRWFVRRWLNLAIDQINERLDTRIQPFRLTQRQAQVERLMFDPKVIAAVEEEARETGAPRSAVMRQAERYAREIVPSLSLVAYFGIGVKLSKWLSELFYEVRLGHVGEKAVKVDPDEATVIFVINHRSNMDYILVTYMASSKASLSYAVGEWARIWVLESLIRAMGAYFIRRNSGNELYRKVLSRYVAMATREGVTQAFFPEGGLSRDGHLNPPRLGLLGYMVGDFDTSKRDILFVPVGLNYDRVLEDRILTAKAEHEATGRDFRVSTFGLLGFIFRLIRLRIRGRFKRYGNACVSFGEPLSLRDWERGHDLRFANLDQQQKFAAVEVLAGDLMKDVGELVPAVPVAVAAHIFLERGDEWIDETELKSATLSLMARLEAGGAHVVIPHADRDAAIDAGIQVLATRRLIDASELGRYRAKIGERLLLKYYANSIEHLVGDVIQ